ncbi:MAG: amidohydrolase family protein, partial [candidate division KSB1 bacterium]|nr:amidohydrolase family protein [candidate division KSB1 bacterium]
MNANVTRREFLKTSVVSAAGLVLGCSVRNRFDLVIRRGLIVDGAGGSGYVRDIGIRGDRIVAIDDLTSASADRIIQAQGLIVAPGFIDIHTHTDAGLLVYPGAESKVHQGVTTEVGGNCGDSPFPLNESDWAELDREFFESYGLHVDWRDIGDFLALLEQKKMSINYAPLTGHGTLRSCVVGRNDVAPTAEQMSAMKNRLAHTLELGSYGLSTGLEYAPGSYATTEELIELCKVVAEHHGIYATHIRNEDDQVEEAVAEALQICRDAEVSLEISHLKACNKSNWHKVDHLLEMIHDASAAGMPVHADRYPYIAYATGLTIFLPLWARQGSTEEVLQRLHDPDQFSKIKGYIEGRGQRIGGWDRVIISS